MALCPYCRHNDGLHSAPSVNGLTDDGRPLAADFRAGRCHQATRVGGKWVECPCPGWHPNLHTTKGTDPMPDSYTDGVGVWRCLTCLKVQPCDCAYHHTGSWKGPTPMPKTTAKREPQPRKQALPSMEDRAIQPLEDAAHEYAAVRDQRMALNAEEVGLKAKLLRLMKHHGKQTYARDGISVEIIVEEESVKVRVKKPESDEVDAAQATEDQESSTAH
jgi:hypothetical protein